MNSPFEVIKKRYITEKTAVLSGLKDAVGNVSLARCENPKYVFLVDSGAKKPEIAQALEAIYAEKSVKVVAVNTVNVKPKMKNRKGRMGQGHKSGYKKAIVTFAVGNSID